jgi:hypothetical protein
MKKIEMALRSHIKISLKFRDRKWEMEKRGTGIGKREQGIENEERDWEWELGIYWY